MEIEYLSSPCEHLPTVLPQHPLPRQFSRPPNSNTQTSQHSVLQPSILQRPCLYHPPPPSSYSAPPTPCPASVSLTLSLNPPTPKHDISPNTHPQTQG
ncbi:hypothetical protein L207DRAFT_520947 [Hyaloscypha variabilis F]|uniref:Uncharacterized protein n=1 Tax=Hyaloscypha variabilis (strain UAMH 11265 / GT02V1 / F) TaxID=1149755 RepID=A0A2J6QT64_HYAVF|nr:hypothetical protein L207DRAFT_520947 [Hyaloscypha variabilis F]